MKYHVRVDDEAVPDQPWLDEEVDAPDAYGALLEADMSVLQGNEGSVSIKITAL